MNFFRNIIEEIEQGKENSDNTRENGILRSDFENLRPEGPKYVEWHSTSRS